MKTFEYEVVIERAAGHAPKTVRRIGFARPMLGEEIVVDRRIYVVERVQHQQDDCRTTHIYTWPRLFVRAKRNA